MMTPKELEEAYRKGEWPPPQDVDPTAFEINFDPTVQRMVGRAVHGNTPFDVPFISSVAKNLYQGGCQNGLVLPTFIDYVVSLYPWERYTSNHELTDEIYIRMFDSEDQMFDEVDDIARTVIEWRKQGSVLIHCQAGLNRSALITARVLMLDDGMTADEAITHIRSQRSDACLCNQSFESWLRSL